MKLHFFHRFNKKPHIALFFIILLFGNCKKDVPDNVIEIEYLQSNILYDNEGNIYKTVVIGNQEWMAENLNTSVHTYGYSNCYGDLPENCTKYGRLYTIEAVMNGQPPSLYNPSGIRGICPAGWHIPSDAEWRQLEVGNDT